MDSASIETLFELPEFCVTGQMISSHGLELGEISELWICHSLGQDATPHDEGNR